MRLGTRTIVRASLIVGILLFVITTWVSSRVLMLRLNISMVEQDQPQQLNDGLPDFPISHDAAGAATTTTFDNQRAVALSRTSTTSLTKKHPAEQRLLQCLQHEPIWVNASHLPVTTNATPTPATNIKLQQRSSNKQKIKAAPAPPPVVTLRLNISQNHHHPCGTLRRDWLDNPPLSELARHMWHHQANCSLPVATVYLDNLFGIGSHITLWSQAMCHAFGQQVRLRTENLNWLWLDQTYCNVTDAAHRSPLLCYFPTAEFLCGKTEPIWPSMYNVSDPRDRKLPCSFLNQHQQQHQLFFNESLALFRAAFTEYLFRSISPLVIQEAQRQIGVLFGSKTNGESDDVVVVVPDDLITVHIRWGDKFFEMKLVIISEYFQAISQLLVNEMGRPDNSTANIYLATEDPAAVRDFVEAASPGWTIYVDRVVTDLQAFRPRKGNRASWTAKNTKGRAGLLALASLLVSMEANYFVLTTGSNWSRLMNHLRTNFIDPRCGNCTRMIDLRPGNW